MSSWGLTPEEDAELRRLHFMLRFGAAASRLTQRYVELRKRDRRAEVRDPEPADEGPAVPRQHTSEPDVSKAPPESSAGALR